MNINNAILEEAKKIAFQIRNAQPGKRAEYLEKAEKVLMDYLKDNLQDTQAWLLLTRIECNSPLDDYDRIVHYANHILSYDPSNAYALLFLSYADHFLRGNLDDDFINRLCMAHNDDPAVMSMIEVAKARYFELRDKKKYEEALKRSIEYWPYHTRNLCTLGELYIEQGKIKEGNALIEQGRKNIKELVINPSLAEYDPTNIDEFLAEFFAGTITTML